MQAYRVLLFLGLGLHRLDNRGCLLVELLFFLFSACFLGSFTTLSLFLLLFLLGTTAIVFDLFLFYFPNTISVSSYFSMHT